MKRNDSEIKREREQTFGRGCDLVVGDAELREIIDVLMGDDSLENLEGEQHE